jgi:hypothetical protein
MGSIHYFKNALSFITLTEANDFYVYEGTGHRNFFLDPYFVQAYFFCPIFQNYFVNRATSFT